MKAPLAMHPGGLLPLTLLFSLILHTLVWFFPAQASSISDFLRKFHLPVEQEWLEIQSVAWQITYAFGDLMLVVGFCQTLIFVASNVERLRPALMRNRNRKIFRLLGTAAMLIGINSGLWAEIAAGMVPVDKASLVQILSPILSLSAGMLLAGAVLTSRLPSDEDPL